MRGTDGFSDLPFEATPDDVLGLARGIAVARAAIRATTGTPPTPWRATGPNVVAATHERVRRSHFLTVHSPFIASPIASPISQ